MPSGVYEHHSQSRKTREKQSKSMIGKNKKPRETRVCECGCGETFECKINSKQRFIYGHSSRGENNPAYGKPAHNRIPRETRICECGCKRTFECQINSKQRFIRGHNERGKHRIPKETRICENPNCDITFEVLITSTQKYCCHPCAIEVITKSEERNKKVGENQKGRLSWNKDLTKETDFRVAKNAEGRSENQKQLWQDPEYVAMQMRARNVCPNKAEMFLSEFFQDLLPNEYIFAGDGKDKDSIIAGKCPDFVNVNGQKKIIELFGEHVHEPEEEQQRIDLFAQHGYQTLIIWYKELQNLDLVKQKVLEFACV
jgi:hypothetical protein